MAVEQPETSAAETGEWRREVGGVTWRQMGGVRGRKRMASYGLVALTWMVLEGKKDLRIVLGHCCLRDWVTCCDVTEPGQVWGWISFSLCPTAV